MRRHLEGGEPVGDVRRTRPRSSDAPGRTTHDGADLLAESLVGHADDRGLGHVGVLVERGFDLGRVDVLAAADDDVLQPVDDVEVAVGVEAAEVAGVEPAVGERLGRLASRPR